jgi:hypothetical protein
MAKKKDSGRPPVLSEEYVIDSDSDRVGEVHPSVQNNTTENPKTPRKPKVPSKPKGTSLLNEKRKVASGGHADSSIVNGQKEATENSSSSPDGSSDEEESKDQRDEKEGKAPRKKAMKPM